MRNTFLIAKREYLERVRSRSFVIMTLFIPALMFGVTVVPAMLANRGTNETKRMVVVAADRDTAEMIRSRIEQKQDQPDPGKKDINLGQKRGLPPAHFTVEVSTDITDAQRAALTEKVKDKTLDGFLCPALLRTACLARP
jgi:ABC-2 type transport system permease protein